MANAIYFENNIRNVRDAARRSALFKQWRQPDFAECIEKERPRGALVGKGGEHIGAAATRATRR